MQRIDVECRNAMHTSQYMAPSLTRQNGSKCYMGPSSHFRPSSHVHAKCKITDDGCTRNRVVHISSCLIISRIVAGIILTHLGICTRLIFKRLNRSVHRYGGFQRHRHQQHHGRRGDPSPSTTMLDTSLAARLLAPLLAWATPS